MVISSGLDCGAVVAVPSKLYFSTLYTSPLPGTWNEDTRPSCENASGVYKLFGAPNEAPPDPPLSKLYSAVFGPDGAFVGAPADISVVGF